ncbi:MAG: type IV secretory system conjugative DNA transfer family protein [Desulfotomaculales bacterium]
MKIKVTKTRVLIALLLVFLPFALLLDVRLVTPPAANFYASVTELGAVLATQERKAEVADRAKEIRQAAAWCAEHPAAALAKWLTVRPQYPEVRSAWLMANVLVILGLGMVVGAAKYHAYKNPILRARRKMRQEDKPPSAAVRWWENRQLDRTRRADHPPGGVLLGVEKATGRPVVITDQEANQHVFLVGTTGSGKTTTMMNFVESALQRGLPCVTVDGKGDPDLVGRIRALVVRHGRPFSLFGMRGDSCSYNPLAHGGITELTDKLLYLTEWSEPHYEALARRYLQAALRVLKATGTQLDLPTLTRHLDPDALATLARRITDDAEREVVFGVLSLAKAEEIKGLIARLALMAESEIGHLFAAAEGKTLDLAAVINQGAAAVFSLNSLAFPEYSRLLGRLVIADLKTVADRQLGSKIIYTIFDEFSVFASRAVVDLIGKARSKGFHTCIATQSLADIEAACGRAVVRQIIGNCNTLIIQRQRQHEDAQALAGEVGTRRSYELTHQVETGLVVGGTGYGTVRETREFVVHPDEIKRLPQGEAILVRSDPFRVQRVRVRKPGER